MNSRLSSYLSGLLLDRDGRARRRVIAMAKAIEAEERLTVAERDNARRARLGAVLEHARRSVPFYRDIASRNGVPSAGSIETLHAFPIIDKDRIRANPLAFHSEDAVDWTANSTGGSSGQPFVFRIDLGRRLAGEAGHRWANSMAGWFPGARTAMLWGADRDVKSATARLRSRLRNWIENIRWYDAFDMGPEKMGFFREDMRRFAPHVIVGYAGALWEFARFLEGEGEEVGFPLVSIVSSAEVLMPTMREGIEQVFKKPVFDRYGSREFGPVAAECEAHCGLHINEHDCIVKIDSPEPERVPGRLIITYLRNYAMPFIRYDTGDLATFMPDEPCVCGRTTRRLARIIGREADSFRTAEGNLVHGEYFTHVLYGTNDVRAFQFVQEEMNRYRLVLEADRARTRNLESEWLSRIRHAVGATAQVDIEYVDRIPLLPSGKRKFTVSRIGS